MLKVNFAQFNSAEAVSAPLETSVAASDTAQQHNMNKDEAYLSCRNFHVEVRSNFLRRLKNIYQTNFEGIVPVRIEADFWK